MTTNDSRENTYVFDPESIAEMGRLIDQDRMVTTTMGGPLAGIEDSSFQNVIDLACGPGGWVLDVAFEYPDAEVCGVDISHGMIEYANARASSQGIKNASFGVMDITQPIDFADASFDLVNARFIFSVLKKEAWPGFLAECTRILRPGGTLRLTEPLDPGETNSPAFNQLASLLLQAMHRAGYGFSTNGRTFAMAPTLMQRLHEMGYQQLRTFMSVQNFSEYMPTWADFLRNNEIAYQQTLPLLVKMGLTSQEEGEHLYTQMRIELRGQNFAAMAYTTTMLGIRPV
jgi:ubiquinone/menaquinone biosynthesis C-methylase UbiE